MNDSIPVFEPEIGQEEIDAVVEAMKRGEISGSFGKAIPEFENGFAKYCGAQFGVAVSSGTTALHLAASAIGIQPGDEVLVSACTNIATALAVYHHGGIPVPVDSESHTWNLNLDLVESLITPKTKAIIPVHIYGHPVDMPRLLRIAEKHGLYVIEDCAESHGATAHGRMTGSFGDIGCFSFYANKIITTGEGGMLVTDDKELADRVRLLRNLAFTTPRFRHELAGYNFRMTGFQAAMGTAQLKKIERFIEAKRRLAATYNRYLEGVAGIQTPAEEKWARNVYWMYGILVDGRFGISRDQLMQALAQSGIETRTFFCPMNLQPFLRSQKGYREVSCPVAERLWEQGLYLPSGTQVTEKQIRWITDKIKSFTTQKAAA